MIPFCILMIADESDRDYMAQLYIQYQRLMYHTIYKIVKDSSKTEDILQTTLEKLIDKLQLLRELDRDHLVSYVIAACRNNAYNELQYNARHPVFSFEECQDLPDMENSKSVIEEWLVREDMVERLLRVWPELDARSQYVLQARYILNLPAGKIAEELHIKPDSVRMALTRARKNLAHLLKESR